MTNRKVYKRWRAVEVGWHLALLSYNRVALRSWKTMGSAKLRISLVRKFIRTQLVVAFFPFSSSPHMHAEPDCKYGAGRRKRGRQWGKKIRASDNDALTHLVLSRAPNQLRFKGCNLQCRSTMINLSRCDQCIYLSCLQPDLVTCSFHKCLCRWLLKRCSSSCINV